MKRSALLLIFLAGCLPVESTELIHTTGEVPMRRASYREVQEPTPSKPHHPHPAVEEPAVEQLRQQAEPERPKRFRGLLVGEAKEQLYRRFIRDGSTAFLRDEDLIFYDDEVMPRVYQVSDEGTPLPLVQRTVRNVSANNEFPWNLPGGITGGNHKEIRFIRPPLDGPLMEWWTLRENGTGRSRGIDWRFMPGTMVGEILLVTDPSGFDHTSIVRTRTRRENGTWRVNQHQPIVSQEDLANALDRRGWQISSGTLATLDSLDSIHPRNRFRSVGLVEPIPNMRPGVVADILDREPFQSVSGKQWRFDSPEVFLPTVRADQGFSLFPSGFLGGLISVDTVSCMRCHEDAGRLVAIPEEGERRWRIRGNNGIFSFHVFDAATIDSSRVQFNPRLIQTGLLRHRDGFP